MRIAYYFSTEDQRYMEAYKQDSLTSARVEATAERFAALFGARPLFTHGFDSHFAGITFDAEHPCYHPDLWTKPTQENPLMVPRSPERAGSKNRVRAEQLYKQFHENWPKDIAEVRASTLLEALGLDRSTLDNELLMFEQWNTKGWFASTLRLDLLAANLQEVLASAFQRALMGNQQPTT